MDKFVYIRVDGNAEIGLGHLVRCIAIAQMLKDDFAIHFFSMNIPFELRLEIEQSGFKFTELSSDGSFLQLLKGNEIVILDNYFYSVDFHKSIKSKGCLLICIDDIHNQEFFADLIINHAPNSKFSDYITRTSTLYALGLDFALLRPSFLRVAKRPRVVSSVEKVFVCFGGGDFKNYTKSVLDFLVRLVGIKEIIVVTGPAYNFKDTLSPILAKDLRISYYHSINEDEVLRLLSSSDVAIVPASSILFEALAAGCIVLSGLYVDNQKFIVNANKVEQFFIDVGNFDDIYLADAFDRLSNLIDVPVKKFIDGYSSERIRRLVNQLYLSKKITLRSIDIDDLGQTFAWASDSKLRQYSFNKSEIIFDEHVKWFNKKLQSLDCLYFIASIDDCPLGSIRFEIEGKLAVISYMIGAEFHGRGLGVLLMKLGIEEFLKMRKDCEELVGYVLKANIPSVKVFERLGFYRYNDDKYELRFVKPINYKNEN